MKHLATRSILVIALVLGLSASVSLADTGKVAGGVVASQSVEVKDVRFDGDTVHGELVNKSSRALRDVHLVIRNAWLWKDERKPGANNPSRSEFYSLPGEIAAGARVPFSYRMKGVGPARNDGKFVTSVEVVSYSLVGR